jgi:biotin-dependent carboxylase-like uncharacterized protein
VGRVTPCLRVTESGPSSSFQDGGRFGYLDYGVAPAGPCDPLLHAIANTLVGNSPEAAAIEYTLKGDTYEVCAASCQIAVTGDFTVEIDGIGVDAWRTHRLRQGQILSVRAAMQGVRGYLAVAGSFILNKVLGSHSTHARSGISAHIGGNIKAGDELEVRRSTTAIDIDLQFDLTAFPQIPAAIRIIWGPQDDYFGKQELASFEHGTFVVTPQSDRMGCQLNGPGIRFDRKHSLISEGIALGSIQVPSEGLFIVALMDRQTVGGYAKIATIVSSDIRAIT